MEEFTRYICILSTFTLLFISILTLGHFLVEEVINNTNALPWENANPNIEHTLKSISGNAVFDDGNTPQYSAASWMIDQNYSNVTLVIAQRYVLATLYYSTNGEKWGVCSATENNTVPCSGAQYPYLSEMSECLWYGSTCNNATKQLSHVSDLRDTLLVSTKQLTHCLANNETLPTIVKQLHSVL